MRQLLGLILAFGLLVTGIESLHVLSAWWQGDRTTVGLEIWLAGVALAGVGYLWWRHSIFNCKRGQCLLPEDTRHNNSPPRAD